VPSSVQHWTTSPIVKRLHGTTAQMITANDLATEWVQERTGICSECIMRVWRLQLWGDKETNTPTSGEAYPRYWHIALCNSYDSLLPKFCTHGVIEETCFKVKGAELHVCTTCTICLIKFIINNSYLKWLQIKLLAVLFLLFLQEYYVYCVHDFVFFFQEEVLDRRVRVSHVSPANTVKMLRFCHEESIRVNLLASLS
jgi:hypothetical protein